MKLLERKRLELAAKLASLEVEFGEWLERSETGGPMEKHHTQIRRVTRQLLGLKGRVEQELAAIGDEPETALAHAREAERVALELHRIWEFFRAKFLARMAPWLADYLGACDELAWDCYHAGQRRWVRPRGVDEGANREPPLVFFNGGSSPFVQPRNWAYRAEEVPGERLSTPELAQVLRRLPVPVIGVPWFQVRHLPDSLFLCHECGHALEDDFGLTNALRVALERAFEAHCVPAERRRAWGAWSGEVFADVCGVLASGPAYVGALCDFLAGPPSAIAAEVATGDDGTLYPPIHLRVQVALAALHGAGHGEEAARRRAEWLTLYPEHAMEAFEPDAPGVASALAAGPYPSLGGCALGEVLAFTTDDHAHAATCAADALAGMRPRYQGPRILCAAARLAFEKDPAAYAASARKPERRPSALIVARILDTRAAGVRARKLPEREKDLAALDARDVTAGALLLELVGATPGK